MGSYGYLEENWKREENKKVRTDYDILQLKLEDA
jgi:hypothetical protein